MTKRVLVTGMNSRACNPAKNRLDVLFSGLIAEVCRDLGYEVEHRNPTVQETYDEFDHIFLGLAPLHSLGSNRAYGALSAYLRGMAGEKITLYLDDAQTQNVWNGVCTVHNDPRRLVKSFFNYKLEYSLANDPQWHQWLMTAVDMMHEYAWPTTVFPAFPWADLDQLKRKTPNVVDAVGLDLTAYLPNYVEDIKLDGGRRAQWVTETRDDRWLVQQRAEFALLRYGKGHLKRPTDEGLLQDYAASWGVLDRGEDHGWWTSRIGYAAQARAVYITKWQNVDALGEPYWPLADAVEGMSREQRDELAEAQAEALAARTSTREEVRDRIRALVEKDA